MMVDIAIIPARGGSKRIAKKNIKDFHGLPIIAYTIKAAQNSGCFDRIIVSTDCQEIKNVALSFGAEVPFERPEDISDDYATTIDVMKHAINWLEEKGTTPNLLCCLYATAPFLKGSNIVNGKTALTNDPSADYAATVTSFPFPIQRGLIIKNNRLEMLLPEHVQTRSQDLEESFHDAGQFYWGRPNAFLSNTPILSKHTIPVMVPRHLVQDIDTEEDWRRAELLYKAYMSDENNSDV